MGNLIEDTSGNLFGTAIFGGGGIQVGTVFEWVKSSSTLSALASFNGSNGAYPAAGLVQDTNGNLFGTTNQGGASNAGTVFEAVPPPVVAGISPNVGPHTGGTSVTISGTGLANATAVHFGSTAATIISDTATQIVVRSPAEPLGSVDVTVTTAGGTSAASSADRFSYTTTSTTWTGLSDADQNWSDLANWSNGVPGPGDTAVFSSTAGASTAVVDAAFSVVLSIASNWGGDIEVNQPLTTTGSSQWVSGTINVVGGVTWTNSDTLTLSGGGNLSLGGIGVLNDRGTLTVAASTTFTDSGEYRESGTLFVLSGATTTLSGAFDNYDGVGTLSGGLYHIVGTFQFANAAIVTANAVLVLNGPAAQYTDLNGTDALGPNLTTIASGGLIVENGASFTSPTDFSVAGFLEVAGSNSSFTSGGNLSVAGGASLYVLNQGSVTSGGNLSVAAGALVDVDTGGSVSTTGDFSNQGRLVIDGNARVGSGTVNVGGSYTQAAGGASLMIQSGDSLSTGADFNDQGSMTLVNGATISVGGNLNVAAGAALTVLTGGALGITRDLNNLGSLVIGTGVTVGVGGNYTQGSAASLDCHLGGAGAGQFGSLAVTGTATLDGTLKATLVNGYVPHSGDTIPVLTFASRSGDFATGPAGFNRVFDDVNGILNLVAP
jgi:hypothetical protein